MSLHTKEEFARALPAGFDGVFDWDFLKGAFPRDIMPMDIDACVEISSKFLLFETKKPGVQMPKGQQRTMRELIKLPTVSIIVTDGKRYDEFRKMTYYHGAHVHVFCSDYTNEVADKIFAVSKRWADLAQWSNGLSVTECQNLGLIRSR